MTYMNIGNVLMYQGDYENALLQHQKSLEIKTRVFNQDHPDVDISYTNVAALYHGQYHGQGKKCDGQKDIRYKSKGAWI